MIALSVKYYTKGIIMIMYVVTVTQDGVVTDKFYYTDEVRANKTVAINMANGYDVVKETKQVTD